MASEAVIDLAVDFGSDRGDSTRLDAIASPTGFARSRKFYAFAPRLRFHTAWALTRLVLQRSIASGFWEDT